MISPMQIFWPDLWDRLFTPGYVPVDPEMGGDLSGISFPSSDEEFDALMAEIEAEEAEARRAGYTPGPTS